MLAAQRASRLRDPDRLRSWLYAIARNEYLRVLRSQARPAPSPSAAPGSAAPTGASGTASPTASVPPTQSAPPTSPPPLTVDAEAVRECVPDFNRTYRLAVTATASRPLSAARLYVTDGFAIRSFPMERDGSTASVTTDGLTDQQAVWSVEVFDAAKEQAQTDRAPLPPCAS